MAGGGPMRPSVTRAWPFAAGVGRRGPVGGMAIVVRRLFVERHGHGTKAFVGVERAAEARAPTACGLPRRPGCRDSRMRDSGAVEKTLLIVGVFR